MYNIIDTGQFFISDTYIIGMEEDGVLYGAVKWASVYLSFENIVKITTVAGSTKFEVCSVDFA